MTFNKRVTQQKRRVNNLNRLNKVLIFNLMINNLTQAGRTQNRINNLINLI